MGSTRLSGKVLKKIKDKTILEHVAERLKQSRYANKLIIATTNNVEDDKIKKEAQGLGTEIYRGSESNVLSRYYHAAKEYHLDTVIRVTSDCPLIDPHILDDMIEVYLENNYDVVTNVGMESYNRTFPRGLDIEIFSFLTLEEAFKNAKEKYQKEHVTPYIYENSNSVFNFKNEIDYSDHRWTVDTPQDFELISSIYDYLYKDSHDFYLNEIIDLFNKHPELFKVNAEVEQKKIKDVE